MSRCRVEANALQRVDFRLLAVLASLMATLVVRNVEAAVVKALKARAGKRGISAEAEHREILRDALLGKRKKQSFVEFLQSMPDVGEDADFRRHEG